MGGGEARRPDAADRVIECLGIRRLAYSPPLLPAKTKHAEELLNLAR